MTKVLSDISPAFRSHATNGWLFLWVLCIEVSHKQFRPKWRCIHAFPRLPEEILILPEAIPVALIRRNQVNSHDIDSNTWGYRDISVH